MIIGTTILKKRGNVAPLNARESADVADQYYRSATSRNSRKNARGLKSDGRAARLPGQPKFGGELCWNRTCFKRTKLHN